MDAKKILSIIFISASLLLVQSASSSYADLKLSNLNSLFNVGNHSNDLDVNTKGKEKEQERIKNNKFMVKGVVSASSSSSLTINNQLINIDSSVTGHVKIVGNVKPGAYAMVQGIIQNSNFYANKIVVNQRNKKEVEENDDNDEISQTPTATPTPTLSPTLSPTPTPTGTESALILNTSEEGGVNKNFNMKTLLEAIHELLTSFRSVLLSI